MTHAVCAHYPQCGGCTLQHLPLHVQQQQKQQHLVHVLHQHGVHVQHMYDLKTMPTSSRRRTTLHMYRAGKTLVTGYKQARSTKIVAVTMCPILTPTMQEALPQLEPMLSALLPDCTQMKIMLTQVDNQMLDVAVLGVKTPQGAAMGALLRKCSQWKSLARLSIDQDIVYQIAIPTITLNAKVRIELPVGGTFLQPSIEGQYALCHSLAAHWPNNTRYVIDLFCGIGTFSAWALAHGAHVHAYDNVPSACYALQKATAHLTLHAHVRDLFAHPLHAKDIPSEAVVIVNPPRAGALAQITQLAVAQVTHIAYISCSAATFARDALVLQKAGYTCSHVQPIDQFIFSNHVELVAHFRL